MIVARNSPCVDQYNFNLAFGIVAHGDRKLRQCRGLASLRHDTSVLPELKRATMPFPDRLKFVMNALAFSALDVGGHYRRMPGGICLQPNPQINICSHKTLFSRCSLYRVIGRVAGTVMPFVIQIRETGKRALFVISELCPMVEREIRCA